MENNIINNQNNIPENTPASNNAPASNLESNLGTDIVATNGKNKKLWIIILVVSLIIVGIVVFGFLYFAKNKSGSLTSLVGKSSLNVCDNEYEKLLALNKLDENLCEQGNIRIGEFVNAEVKKTKTNIVLIFDSSGSMAAKIDGKSKIDIAKNATNKFVEKIKDSGANLSMIVYGHKGSNNAKDKAVSCAGIDEAYWLGAINPNIVKTKFDNTNPTGWTPIASALEKAKGILLAKASKGDNNIILLVSDGEETCNGDPIAVTKGIKNANFNIKVNVIGFDVGGTTEDQLRAIAGAGDGQFSSVKNEKDFEAIFQEQENMVNKMDFAVKRGVEQLYDISSAILKHNQCVMMLNLEEAGFMLNVEEQISANCKTSAEEKYFKRYDEMKNNLKATFANEKKAFDTVSGVK